jgi:hypothetical protein
MSMQHSCSQSSQQLHSEVESPLISSAYGQVWSGCLGFFPQWHIPAAEPVTAANPKPGGVIFVFIAVISGWG